MLPGCDPAQRGHDELQQVPQIPRVNQLNFLAKCNAQCHENVLFIVKAAIEHEVDVFLQTL